MTDGEITICSVNCRGLSGKKKRSDVLNYLRNKPYSIFCLVDTHFTQREERFIRSEWGYEVYFNSFCSLKRGVAIFFKNNFEFKLHNYSRDKHLLYFNITWNINPIIHGMGVVGASMP